MHKTIYILHLTAKETDLGIVNPVTSLNAHCMLA